MYTKLLQYQNFINLLLHFLLVSSLVIFPFPSDESKTPESIFPGVEARKTLRIFFYLFLSVIYLLEKEIISHFFLKFNTQYNIQENK